MKALVAIDLPIVLLPDAHLRKILGYSETAPRLLSPEYVRGFILGDASRARMACNGKATLAAALLGYCLVDIDDAHPEGLVKPPVSQWKLSPMFCAKMFQSQHQLFLEESIGRACVKFFAMAEPV